MWETPAISSYAAIEQAILETNKTRLRDVARVTVIANLTTILTNILTYLSATYSRAQQGYEQNTQRLSMSDLRYKH